MLRVALLGLGKMGISHLAILNAHPDVELAAVCDTSEYLLDVLGKYACAAHLYRLSQGSGD